MEGCGSVTLQPRPELQPYLATADQMRQIEQRSFDAGMPVAALMEKVAGLLTRWMRDRYPASQCQTVGVLVGPGHNGGDALVMARELHFRGYRVRGFQPLERLKPLTQSHADYARSLGIPFVDSVGQLADCDVILDGLFGFGLTRPIEGVLGAAIATLNASAQPVVGIDLPSGIHTDTGEALGQAVRAAHTLCLGLWKRAFVQAAALPYLGQAELIDFDLPLADIQAVLGVQPKVSRLTAFTALAGVPLPRSPAAHKYQVGELLLIAGSRAYGGTAILAGLGARGSGVGMLTLAVPESLRLPMLAQLPEALVLGCAETASGAIARLPEHLDLARYGAIACGPGLSREAPTVVEAVIKAPTPLVLDADGLNILATGLGLEAVRGRAAETVLTPHPGEFKRLFPDAWAMTADAATVAQTAAKTSGAVVLLKGARSVVASPDSRLWHLPQSTPALARGGSGDVLTGLIGGLLAAGGEGRTALSATLAGVWWHAQAALKAAGDRTELGVDPMMLASALTPTLAAFRANQ